MSHTACREYAYSLQSLKSVGRKGVAEEALPTWGVSSLPQLERVEKTNHGKLIHEDNQTDRRRRSWMNRIFNIIVKGSWLGELGEVQIYLLVE